MSARACDGGSPSLGTKTERRRRVFHHWGSIWATWFASVLLSPINLLALFDCLPDAIFLRQKKEGGKGRVRRAAGMKRRDHSGLGRDACIKLEAGAARWWQGSTEQAARRQRVHHEVCHGQRWLRRSGHARHGAARRGRARRSTTWRWRR